MDDEERVRRPVRHEIGQNLDDLSVHDFDERIEIMRAEIARLEIAKTAKQAARDQAGSVFGPRSS